MVFVDGYSYEVYVMCEYYGLFLGGSFELLFVG